MCPYPSLSHPSQEGKSLADKTNLVSCESVKPGDRNLDDKDQEMDAKSHSVLFLFQIQVEYLGIQNARGGLEVWGIRVYARPHLGRGKTRTPLFL